MKKYAIIQFNKIHHSPEDLRRDLRAAVQELGGGFSAVRIFESTHSGKTFIELFAGTTFQSVEVTDYFMANDAERVINQTIETFEKSGKHVKSAQIQVLNGTHRALGILAVSDAEAPPSEPTQTEKRKNKKFTPQSDSGAD